MVRRAGNGTNVATLNELSKRIPGASPSSGRRRHTTSAALCRGNRRHDLCGWISKPASPLGLVDIRPVAALLSTLMLGMIRFPSVPARVSVVGAQPGLPAVGSTARTRIVEHAGVTDDVSGLGSKVEQQRDEADDETNARDDQVGNSRIGDGGPGDGHDEERQGDTSGALARHVANLLEIESALRFRRRP